MTIRSAFRNNYKILAAALLVAGMFMVTSCRTREVTLVDITFEGGSGKAHVESPVSVATTPEGMFATLVWSSEKYDYVIVDGNKYLNENPGGKSTFTVPVKSLEEPLQLIGDTTAMSTPHEIEYTITWNLSDGSNATDEESGPDDAPTGFGIRDESQPVPAINGKNHTGKLKLSSAKGFDVFEYEDYKLIRIYGVGDHLLVPEGENVPEDVPEDVTILKAPLDKTYLVSTSVMDFVRQLNCLDMIAFSSQEADKWYIDEAAALIRSGDMKYAGKYRAPDYELLLSEGCSLAIENTMIYHEPEVAEKLEDLGIPVIVETSSYEEDPLGRLEWIKLYGVLFGQETKAHDFYEEQAAKISKIKKEEGTKKKVALFYVSSTGMICVRTPGDYITKMIEMAGAIYVPGKDDIKGSSGMGTMNMQMEDFYAMARDADILIYNSTITGEIRSLSDLIEKNALFSDMKAVKSGDVYCLESDFFQKTCAVADFVADMGNIISNDASANTFIKKVEGNR